ncbi:MAG: holo-ACP synthase [Spirochaetota bacterium]
MIIGIGVDIVSVQRMSSHCHDETFLRRFLHPGEVEDIQASREDKAQLLASRFAVKEAFGKALGSGLRDLSLSDIQLDHDTLGRPFVVLHGNAQKRFASVGAERIFVSLSHERQMAAAVVILESS